MKVWTSINRKDYADLIADASVRYADEEFKLGYIAMDSIYKFPLSLPLLLYQFPYIKGLLGLDEDTNFLVELDTSTDSMHGCDSNILLEQKRHALYDGCVLAVPLSRIEKSEIAVAYEYVRMEDGSQQLQVTQLFNEQNHPTYNTTIYYTSAGIFDYFKNGNDPRIKNGMSGWSQDMMVYEIKYCANSNTLKALETVLGGRKLSFEDSLYTMEELFKK